MISIIVPAYNVEAWISNCLDSILGQSYTDIEIIVVDDGSSDCTAQIIDEYVNKDPRVHVYHQQNKGVMAARIFGIEHAAGEWIGFIDADDYIDADMYERLLSNAQKHQAQISHCGYRLDLPDEVVYYYNTGRLVQQDKQEGLTALLDGSYIEPGLWNKLFHKTLFHSLLHEDVMNTTIRIYEDLLMNYYLFREAEKSVYEDFCPYHYVLRTDSATTKRISEHKLKDPLRVVKILLEETKGSEEQHAAVRRRYIRILCNTATTQIAEEDAWIRPYRSEIRRELRRELPEVLSKNHYGMRIKLIALGAGLMPEVYGWLHRLHIRMKNLDKTRSLKN